jgi:hypothetical protein
MAARDDFLASDHDREQAVAALASHWSAGRLDLPAFDERTAAAYAATHRAQLETLLRDLPAEPGTTLPVAAGDIARPSRRRPRMPGIRPFRMDVVLREAPEVVHDQALAHIAPMLGAAGYHIEACKRPGMIRFAATSASALPGLLAVFTGGLSLLAYVRRAERPITILCVPATTPGTTRFIAFGEAPRSVRSAFADLRD